MHTLLIRTFDDPEIVANAAFIAICCEDVDFLNTFNAWMTQPQHWKTTRLPAILAIMALLNGRADIAAVVANIPIDVSAGYECMVLRDAILCAAENECLEVYRPLLLHLRRSDSHKYRSKEEARDESLEKLFHNCKDRSVTQQMSQLWGDYYPQYLEV